MTTQQTRDRIDHMYHEMGNVAYARRDAALIVNSNWYVAASERIGPLIPADRKAEFLDTLEAMLHEASENIQHQYEEKYADIQRLHRAALAENGLELEPALFGPEEPLFD